MPSTRIRRVACTAALWAMAFLSAGRLPLSAEVLWSDPGARVIHKTPGGTDLLSGAVRRDDKAYDVLFFKFEVDPLSDVASEPYFAGLQLFENDTPRLGVGNAPEAWGYSAFNTAETSTLTGAQGEFDLKSAHPEAEGGGKFKPFELPRHNRVRTIVFKVQFVPEGDDLVTVWLGPDLAGGASEGTQPEALTTQFKANVSFNQLRLRHDGGGNGWIFSGMQIATSFHDFVVVRFWQTWWFFALLFGAALLLVTAIVRFVERRKFQRRLSWAEREQAVERERARIAQDLHDDLGSSLARISLLSNLVKLDHDKPAEVAAHADKLAQSANQTVRALEEIVWAVRSGSDSLQSLMDYIAHFAGELSEERATRCRLELPAHVPERTLPPEYRHNVFLVVKEAITNAIKHAQAKQVLVRARVSGDQLEIEITDDGQGFDSTCAPDTTIRNGLQNMRQRAAGIQGHLEIDSRPNRGTTIRLKSTFPPVGRN
jgi:signal transduction histidine kinase